jgi:hypothetical protein
VKQIALTLLAAGCAAPAPGTARMEVRYFDPSGAMRECHVLDVAIEERVVRDVDGTQYRFTLHQDYTVSL